MADAAAPDFEPAWPDDAVEVGRISGAWGIKGWFRVQPHATAPEALLSSRRWFLRAPAPAGPGPKAGASASGLPGWLKITQAREHVDGVVAEAEQVPDRDAAERLQGALVYVSRASFPTPKADEYYWVDLIGMAVINRGGEVLGTVADLMDTGAHSVLRVRAPGAAASEGAVAERLIPFVAAYVDAVDQNERRITVDWGLDY